MRRHAVAVVLSFVSAAVVAVLVPDGAQAAPLRQLRAAARTTQNSTTTPPPRALGVTLPGVPGDLSGLQALDTELGRTPGVVMWYQAWSAGSDFPTADAERISETGAVPEITWEPWDPSQGTVQPSYATAAIAHGRFDSYVSGWARAIKAWGRPLRLRFAHEMNGNWYPWADGVNGNAAGSYVAAWKHVRAVFAKVGVTTVTWVWSPNVPYSGSVPLVQVFPGDANVDVVALDGYNWGDTQPWSTWTSFHDLFAPGLAQLAALSHRPVAIGEVGCAPSGGDKAQWINDMWTALASLPAVRTVTWFDFDKETDWRLDSDPAALSAFTDGLGAYLAG